MKYILILVILITSMTAKTTMCYKNGWDDPSNIEQQIFNGGECKGSNSIDDMKKLGWKVEDIKLSTKNDKINYIYILKSTNRSISTTDSYNKISATIAKEKEESEELLSINKGKKYYTQNCKICHGTKGELEAEGTSRPLNSLSLADIKYSIRGYNMDDYDLGLAIIMRPYASFLDKEKMTNIYNYLKSINKK